MTGQVTIAIALLGFNDLGHSVTPAFLLRNRFYLQLSTYCLKMNKKSMGEGKKNFCPRDIKSSHHAAGMRMELWSLNIHHQLTEFA